MAKFLFNRYARLVAQGIDMTGLDVSFNITKSLDKEPNTSHIDIYNLSPTNRAKLHGAGQIPFEFRIAYLGIKDSNGTGDISNATALFKDQESLMFKGEAKRAFTERRGADIVTILQLQDGARTVREKRLSKSYTAGTPFSTVASDLLKTFDLDNKAALAKVLATLSADTTLDAYTISGNAYAELAKILKKFDYEISIQNGEIVILGPQETLAAGIVKLSPGTGLLDSPQPGKAGKPGASNNKDKILKIKALIQPTIAPGKMLMLQSEAFSGVYRIQKVEYNGSTFDNNWFAEIEGLPIG